MKKISILIALLVMSVSVFAGHEFNPERRTFVTTGEYKSPFNIQNRIYQNILGVPKATAGVERVTHYDPRATRRGGYAYIDRFIYLSPVNELRYEGVGRGGYAPYYARGTIKLRSTTWEGLPSARAKVTTKDVPASERVRAYYQAWLVDDDSGYSLLLGSFTATLGGVGELVYHSATYFDAYDRVEITLKAYEDRTIGPGPVVLTGKISPTTIYYPQAKQTKMITDSFTKI